MSLPNYLAKIKSSGIYRFVWDKSEIPGQQAETLRLVVGYSEKGPFNTPVYVETATDFRNIYGGVSKKLERYGVWFHRMAIQALKKGPILALNLKPFDTEAVQGVSFNPQECIRAVDETTGEIGPAIDLAVKDLYNTNRFWTLEPEHFEDIDGLEDQYINIFATDSKEASNTIFVRGYQPTGYDVTVKEWYSSVLNGEDVPSYLEGHENDYLSQYWAEIYVFKGEFTPAIATSDKLSKFFNVKNGKVTLKPYIVNAFGERLDTLEQLASNSASNFIQVYRGILLPEFLSSTNTVISLDAQFNNDNYTHKMLMRLNQSLLYNGDITISELDTTGWAKSFMPNADKKPVMSLGGLDPQISIATYDNESGEWSFSNPDGRTIDMYSFNGVEINNTDDDYSVTVDGSIFNCGIKSGDKFVHRSVDEDEPEVINLVNTVVDTRNMGKDIAKKLGQEDYAYRSRIEMTGNTDMNIDVTSSLENYTAEGETNIVVSELNKVVNAFHSVDSDKRQTIKYNGTEYTWNADEERYENADEEVLVGVINDELTEAIEETPMIPEYWTIGEEGEQLPENPLPQPRAAMHLDFELELPGHPGSYMEGTWNKNPNENPDCNKPSYVLSEDGYTMIASGIVAGEGSVLEEDSTHYGHLVRTFTPAFTFDESVDLTTTVLKINGNVLPGVDSVYAAMDGPDTPGDPTWAKALYLTRPVEVDSDRRAPTTVTFEYADGIVENFVINFKADGIIEEPETGNNNVHYTEPKLDEEAVIEAIESLPIEITNNEYDLVFHLLVSDDYTAGVDADTESATTYTLIFDKKVSAETFKMTDIRTGDKYDLVKCVNNVTDTSANMFPTYLKGYEYQSSKPTLSTDPTKSSTKQWDKLQWQHKILDVLSDYKGIRTALTGRVDVDYRYIVDTFEGFVEGDCKGRLAIIAKEKDNAFALLNFPPMVNFSKCTYTSFTDAKGMFDTKYIAEGGNHQKSMGQVFTLASEENGASYASYNTCLSMRDLNTGIKYTCPSAALVSNLFMDKYTKYYPYTIVAGPNRAVIVENGLIGPDFNFGREDLDNLEPFGVNAMVYVPGIGTYINSNQTAKQNPVTTLSKINVRELCIFLQDEIEKLLQQYQWDFNTPNLRQTIKDRADVILETAKNNGGVYKYLNVCDESNNTDDVINNEMFVLSTSIEPGMGAGKMVQELTLYRKGGMSSLIVQQ